MVKRVKSNPTAKAEQMRQYAEILRIRAEAFTTKSNLFLGAMLIALIAGGFLFYFLPFLLADQDRAIIEKETREAKIVALRSGKEELSKIIMGPMREQAWAAAMAYFVKPRDSSYYGDDEPYNLNALQFLDDGLRGWAVGEGGTILATTDGGNKWKVQEQTGGAPNDDPLIAVQFLNDGLRGWVLGMDSDIRTTSDGGKNWTKQTVGKDIQLSAVHFLQDGLRGWVSDVDGAIFSTNDGGKIWKAQVSCSNARIGSVQFLTDGLRGWAVGSRGMICATTDGGKTWFKQTISDVDGLSSVHFQSNGSRGWVVGYNGSIFTTSDGGEKWTQQARGTQANIDSVQLLDDGLNGWAVDGNGRINVTIDGGKTWTPQAGIGNTRVNSVQLQTNGKRGWAVGEKGAVLILETNDFSSIKNAKSPDEYGVALKQHITEAPVLASHYANYQTSLETVQKFNNDISDLENGIAGIENSENRLAEQNSKDVSLIAGRDWLSFARSSVTRIGVVGFVIYFISLLSNIYRYNLRLAAFYHARADALSLMVPSAVAFEVLVNKLAPDGLSFGKQTTGPADQAYELTKTAIGALRKG
jgi:photosystem II stability/assembly factor-like uncharacterized protein